MENCKIGNVIVTPLIHLSMTERTKVFRELVKHRNKPARTSLMSFVDGHLPTGEIASACLLCSLAGLNPALFSA